MGASKGISRAGMQIRTKMVEMLRERTKVERS